MSCGNAQGTTFFLPILGGHLDSFKHKEIPSLHPNTMGASIMHLHCLYIRVDIRLWIMDKCAKHVQRGKSLARIAPLPSPNSYILTRLNYVALPHVPCFLVPPGLCICWALWSERTSSPLPFSLTNFVLLILKTQASSFPGGLSGSPLTPVWIKWSGLV